MPPWVDLGLQLPILCCMEFAWKGTGAPVPPTLSLADQCRSDTLAAILLFEEAAGTVLKDFVTEVPPHGSQGTSLPLNITGCCFVRGFGLFFDLG